VVTWNIRYDRWKNDKELDKGLKKQLQQIENDESMLEDAFFSNLTFGTGGIRGVLGVGTNRLNIYTIRKAVKGLSIYLEQNQVNIHDRGVVIAYDSRHMSKEFAIECAKVLGTHQIKAYVFEDIRPTPLLSFAVRYLGAAAGIVITASHNPPDYNGFKVYNEAGSQISFYEANKIISYIEQIGDELQIQVMEKTELESRQLLQWVNGEVDNAYLEQLIKISKMTDEELQLKKDLKIVFTPLHGTALSLVKKGLNQLNFQNVYYVEEQLTPDPEFSTVELPNPEEEQTFQMAKQLGVKQGADLLLATDPDADRLGVAVKNNLGEYVVLTGNQLGVLLLDYILHRSEETQLKNARMIKTIVTTELGRAVADYYGVKTIDTLTGFKYIGEKINEYDSTGETFVFGFEESNGYLINSFARDKDAVQAVVMACEMAQYWKDNGKTLLDVLDDLYKRHGFYKETLKSFSLEGIEGKRQIDQIISEMRNNNFNYVGDYKVHYKEDYLLGKRTFVKDNSEETLQLPKENVIKYVLDDGGWFCVRPSGTEPKIKWYFGMIGSNSEMVNEKLQVVENLMEEMMNLRKINK